MLSTILRFRSLMQERDREYQRIRRGRPSPGAAPFGLPLWDLRSGLRDAGAGRRASAPCLPWVSMPCLRSCLRDERGVRCAHTLGAWARQATGPGGTAVRRRTRVESGASSDAVTADASPSTALAHANEARFTRGRRPHILFRPVWPRTWLCQHSVTGPRPPARGRVPARCRYWPLSIGGGCRGRWRPIGRRAP